METISYLDENGHLSPSCPVSIPDDILVKGLETMLITRLMDERMITLQRQGVITFAMSSLGEEGCSVASAAALELCDWMYPQYRESGVIFWRGYTIQQYVDHMFANEKDILFGRQMPNHFGSRELNVVTVSSPIGTKIPHAAGCAYAMKFQKEKSIAICYFGEGATSEGDFHAGMNFAAVRVVPAIFFCRNNGYAISTPSSRQFASEGVAPKGQAYGMRSIRIDGNDFFAVYATVAEARKYCLEGKGPILIEAMTYRRGAHSTSDDPSLYRNEEEVKSWEKKCPIVRLRTYLQSKNLWSDQQEKTFVDKIQSEITKAIDIAKGRAQPPLHSLIEHVYFAIPDPLKEEYDELQIFLSEK